MVNDDTTNAHQSDPNVSIDDNGNFVVSWFDRRNDDHDVYAQKYLSGGIPFGTNYRISNTGDMYQLRPSVILDNDRIFSSWQDNRGGQSGYDIWANVYDWDFNVGVNDIVRDKNPPTVYLYQNFPNPFSTFTMISYNVKEPGLVSLSIYDLQGKEVSSKVRIEHNKVNHTFSVHGSGLESGIYFYQLNVNNKYFQTIKMVLLK